MVRAYGRHFLLVLAVVGLVVGNLALPTVDAGEEDGPCVYCDNCSGQHCCKETKNGWEGCENPNGGYCIEQGKECKKKLE